ncbi:alpha/beta hydrolase [Sphingobacterium siyangense]|uniref:Acetyl esterase/lipase n=1 Tax=Sphingobacterium siyangense TaxID=459529 RepID=A0A562LZT2_9SPHI|nr:alpha/beta hydrolase [Sphingobacterium siyangense]TWI13072.1 acetyl esterase/lipase [Sphingobacterium siyangense]
MKSKRLLTLIITVMGISSANAQSNSFLSSSAQKFLKFVNEASSVSVADMPLEQARAVYQRSTTLGHPVDMSAVEEISTEVTEGNLSVKIRVVKPKTANGNLPAFLEFHGGVWFMGNYESHKKLLRDIVLESNTVAVFVEYTSSPEAKYPTPLNEGYAVLKWIKKNGSKFGIDTQNIALVGNSVGGNMVAAISLMAKENNDPSIKCQVLISPVTNADFETESYNQFAEKHFLTKKIMMKGWDDYLPNKEKRKEIYASPLLATIDQLKALPPALVITEENDVLRDEGEAYAKKLDEAGVNVTSIRYNGMIHDFVIMDALKNETAVKMSISAISDFLNSHLK